MNKQDAFSIREMTEQDIEQVLLIDQESIANPWTYKDFEACVKRPENHYFVAQVSDMVVGFAGIIKAMDEADLALIAVNPEFRRKHIAQRLLENILLFCQQEHVIAIHLEVRQSNKAALAFYLKNGFEQIGIRKGYYKNPLEDAVILVKHL